VQLLKRRHDAPREDSHRTGRAKRLGRPVDVTVPRPRPRRVVEAFAGCLQPGQRRPGGLQSRRGEPGQERAFTAPAGRDQGIERVEDDQPGTQRGRIELTLS
jgi:hypothetical protein